MKKLLRLVPLILLFTGLVANAQVNNLTNPGNSPYVTIQAAINDAATQNGDIIEVSDGTYTENLTVNKQLTLQSVNGALTTTINGYINITSDLVTVDGFTINNPSGKYGIYAAERSDLTITNNILSVGSTSGNGTTYAIGIVCTNTNVNEFG